MTYQKTSTLLVLIVFFALIGTATARSESPGAVVGKFQQTLLSVMKEAKSLSVQQRYERLEPSVRHSFHMPLMTQIAVGPFWKDASRTQKERLVQAFRRVSISTLATLFDGYKGERFKQLGEQPGPRKLRLVKTEMTRPEKKPISIIYVSKQIRDRWYLIDVIVDNGISELKVRRSEYRQILKSNGVDGLIEALNKKADELANPIQK